MRRTVLSVAAVIGLVVAGAGAQTTKPSAAVRAGGSVTPERKALAAIEQAVEALRKEYQASLKPRGTPLRSKSDFFTENAGLGASVTADAILNALGRRLDADPRADCYVKRQLLSGLAGPIPNQLVGKAIGVYRRAPAPAPRPGMELAEQRRLDTEINTNANFLKPEFGEELARAFAERVKVVDLANEPLFTYRGEFFRKLPPCLPVFLAAFDDACERANMGHSADAFTKEVMAAIRTWAKEGAKLPEMRELGAALRRMSREFESESARAPMLYAELKWGFPPVSHYSYYSFERTRNKRWYWEKKRATVAPVREMESLGKFLEGGGLESPAVPPR